MSSLEALGESLREIYHRIPDWLKQLFVKEITNRLIALVFPLNRKAVAVIERAHEPPSVPPPLPKKPKAKHKRTRKRRART